MSQVHLVEFSVEGDDAKYIAYGSVKESMPVCKLTPSGKNHRRPGSMRFPSILKWFSDGEIGDMRKVDREELLAEYGRKLNQNEPDPEMIGE